MDLRAAARGLEVEPRSTRHDHAAQIEADSGVRVVDEVVSAVGLQKIDPRGKSVIPRRIESIGTTSAGMSVGFTQANPPATRGRSPASSIESARAETGTTATPHAMAHVTPHVSHVGVCARDRPRIERVIGRCSTPRPVKGAGSLLNHSWTRTNSLDPS